MGTTEKREHQKKGGKDSIPINEEKKSSKTVTREEIPTKKEP